MNDPEMSAAPPARWLADLAESDADIDAGRTVAWSEVRADMMRKVAAMENELARNPA